jgi:hypothetical protein
MTTQPIQQVKPHGDIRKKCIAVFISLACTMGCFYWLRGGIIPLLDGNPSAPYFFSAKVTHNWVNPTMISRQLAMRLSGAWLKLFDPKDLLNETDLLMINDKNTGRKYGLHRIANANTPQLDFANVFAAYHAVFIGATLLLLALAVKEPLIPILGTVAGLLVNAAPNMHPFIFPWDMPDMLLFTSAFLLYRSRRWLPLVGIIFIGGMMKESVLVTVFFLFGAPWKVWPRLVAIAAIICAVQFFNSLLIPVGGSQSWIADLGTKDVGRIYNLHKLFTPELPHAIFANAGGLALLIWLMVTKIRDWPLLGVLAAYLSGEFCCGRIDEYRVWFEVLPMGWILISEAMNG